MSIAIDLILALIMVSIVLTAVRRGFVVSVFKLLSAVAAVAVAVLFYRQLGSFFCDRFVYDKVFTSLYDWLQKLAQNADGSFDLGAAVAALPEGLKTLAAAAGLDLSALDASYAGLSAATESAANSLCATLASALARIMADILAFAALFFGMLILLSLVCLILDALCKLPLLKGTNRLLGLVLGVCEALLVGAVITAIASALLGAYGGMHPEFADADAIDRTYLASLLLRLIPR